MSQVRPLSSVLDAIGETPLVELSRLARGVEGRLLAKLEYLNPGASKKDRNARQMIEDARADGTLRPGQAVVELTSGNTGTGLAIVCAVLGHPFVAVMSRGNTPERARMMAGLGAEVVLVDQAPGGRPGCVSGVDLRLVEETAQRVCRERGAFRADQFRLPANARAHYLHTGPEILRQSGHAITAFCDFVGSASTFAGCAAAFKEWRAEVRCYVVEPETAPAIEGGAIDDPSHPIQGGGYSRSPEELALLNPDHVDGFVRISGRAARETARRLAREEGIFAGYSSGANAAAALELLRGPCRGGCVAIVCCDSGLKYLSTDLWNEG